MSDFRDPGRDKTNDGAFRPGDEQPVVGGNVRRLSPIVIVCAFAIFAVALFLVLNARRGEQIESVVTPTADRTAGAMPPPLDLTPRPSPPPPAPVATAPTPAVAVPVAPRPPDDTIPRLHAPAVVVDLQAASAAPNPVAAVPGPPQPAAAGSSATRLSPQDKSDSVPATGAGSAGTPLGAAAAAGSPLLAEAGGNGALNPNMQFASRTSEAAPAPAVAIQMANLGTTITQGATIPAVLETAISSDLPGFTRAIVSRDVLGFDGKNVLIPRGSRVIGQYRNALSLGQSRVFIIWTRVIRPDGVTVQIGSPGADALGRGGLTGDVDSHFFSRFGGAILLSILNGGIAAIAGTPSTEISIGSPAAAAGAAATATIPSGTDILPTINVKQGIAINIFVARDLDFSPVNPIK
jgi:type IV secretion system protein VirB10